MSKVEILTMMLMHLISYVERVSLCNKFTFEFNINNAHYPNIGMI